MKRPLVSKLRLASMAVGSIANMIICQLRRQLAAAQARVDRRTHIGCPTHRLCWIFPKYQEEETFHLSLRERKTSFAGEEDG